jgi:hypothetical protein
MKEQRFELVVLAVDVADEVVALWFHNNLTIRFTDELRTVENSVLLTL